jgi:hypothetical protein
MAELAQTRSDLQLEKSRFVPGSRSEIVPFSSFEIPTKDEEKPDAIGIHSRKQRIDGLLNSAFMETTHRSKSGNDRAIEDFRAAIKSADNNSSNWLDRQQHALSVSQVVLVDKSEHLHREFVAGIDSLPSPTRQKVNELAYKLIERRDQPDVSPAEKEAIQKKLEKLLPPDLRAIARRFPQLDREDSELATALTDFSALKSAPLKTRALAAKFFAGIGNIEESKKLLKEMANIDPRLKDSDKFNEVLADPTILSRDVFWLGEGKLATNPKEQRKKEIIDALKEWFRELLPNDGGATPLPWRRLPEGQRDI